MLDGRRGGVPVSARERPRQDADARPGATVARAPGDRPAQAGLGVAMAYEIFQVVATQARDGAECEPGGRNLHGSASGPAYPTSSQRATSLKSWALARSQGWRRRDPGQGRTPRQGWLLRNRWWGGLFRPRHPPTLFIPAGSGTTSRGSGVRSVGGVRRRSE